MGNILEGNSSLVLFEPKLKESKMRRWGANTGVMGEVKDRSRMTSEIVDAAWVPKYLGADSIVLGLAGLVSLIHWCPGQLAGKEYNDFEGAVLVFFLVLFVLGTRFEGRGLLVSSGGVSRIT